MNKEHQFNQQIWSNLLEEVKILNVIPTISDIVKTYCLSNRIASAYRFALTNKDQFYSNESFSKNIAKIRISSNELKRDNKNLISINKDLENKIDFLLAIDMLEKINFTKIKISQADMSIDENTAISLLSDIHAEEVVEKATVNFINEYNPKIAKQRVKRYFSRLLFIIRNLRKGGWIINNLVLCFLGDMITGYIHEELQESNAMSPTETILFVQDLLISGIKFLSENGEFKTIKVICHYGNHGRTTKRKRYSTGYKNSYEWLMYTQMAKYFNENPLYNNVEIIVSQSEFATIQIYDKTWLTGHGDHFGYMGGIGGVLIPFKRWIHKMGQILPADIHAIGHWHTFVNLPDGIINGSVMGYSAFSIGHGFAPEPPQQQFQLQDSKRGFTINTPIKLEDY